MEYTVQKLARLAGISTRTLRFYDEIGLLKPCRINSSGYRIYAAPQVDLLQQILYYKELGLELDEIKAIVHNENFDPKTALKSHLTRLKEKQSQISKLIENVEKTISYYEGECEMSDNEKFEALKKSLVKDNSEKYGDEVKAKYGAEAFETSNKKFMNMSEKDFNEMNDTNSKLMELLALIAKNGDDSGEKSLEAAKLHKKWLSYTWGQYSKEAHLGLAEMYMADERFAAYYDAAGEGCAAILVNAIKNHIDAI